MINDIKRKEAKEHEPINSHRTSEHGMLLSNV